MKSTCYWLLAGLLGGPPLLTAQTLVDLRTQTKSVDFSAAPSTKPNQTGTTLPATCSTGATFFNVSAPAGQNLYGCTSTNTWTLLGSNLLFGGGSTTSGNCAQFNSAGKIVDAGAPCSTPTAVTMASPFAAAGSLLVSAGPGRQGVASLCTNSGGTLTCPGGFSGAVSWPAGSGANTRQILAPTGALTTSFTYTWADAVPSSATLMKIGTPSAGTSSLGPAIPDTDYVTPSGSGTLRNKTLDGTSLLSSYLAWAQIATPSAPAAGYLRVYAKTGAGVCWMNSSGVETCSGAGVGDPGGSGLVVETSPGVTANRSIAAGSSNINVVNGSGAGGNPTVDIGSSVNFSGKTTLPVQVGVTAGIPNTCSPGQMYFETDGVSGRQLQTCVGTNTWAPVAYGQGTGNPLTCSLGQVYFNTSASPGQNLYLCSSANTWNQMTGAITSIFGRTGAVAAQAGDYSYSQIANTPTSLPPSGSASGDLSGSYPNPTVSQVNGAGVPANALIKSNGSRQLVQATAGFDYMGTGTPVQASQMPAHSGDCTSVAGSTALTCSKTNGTAFAPSAIADTTNASNIVSGTLGAARLPGTTMQTNQSNTMIGGTQDFRAAAHTMPAVTGTSTGLPGTCTVGEVFFATNVTAGQNQFYCTSTNVWTQQSGGGVSSVFGRTGTVIAQAGDYSYSQISNTPTALPPSGVAAGDLSGSYPSPKVSQINGAAVPTAGVLKANGSGQLTTASPGTDYAPATAGSGVLKGNGAGAFASAGASDITALFIGCSGTQYLGADGVCHTVSSGSGGGGSGYVVLTTGAGAPAASCNGPSSTNLSVYLDTTNNDQWWCNATNSWKKTLSVTGSGPYQANGATGPMPASPGTGTVTCYYDMTLGTQVCLDSSGNSWQMIRETMLADIQTRSCDISIGDASAAGAITNGQLGPQKHICKIPSAATTVEVDIEADAGSPNVIVGRRRCMTFTSGICSSETVVNLLSSTLSATSGYMGCSNAGGTTGTDGGTVCAATLQNSALNAGDWIELVSGTAGGTARLVTVHIVYTVN